jgi:hypothetical protein
MTQNCKSTAYGERIDDFPALLAIAREMTPNGDGMYRASFLLDPKHGVPLRRALMRVEAELLIEDADSIGSEEFEDRTPEERAADALFRLIHVIS